MTYSPRAVTAAGTHEADGRIFKRYEVVAAGRRISEDLRAAALQQLPGLAALPMGDAPRAGWSVLHRGEDAVWVVAYSWVWNEVVEAHTAVAGNPSLGAGGSEETSFGILDRRWFGCIWELAPLAHERAAWIGHVLRPATPDLDGYLADTLADGLY